MDVEGYPPFKSELFTAPYFITTLDGEVCLTTYHSYDGGGFLDFIDSRFMDPDWRDFHNRTKDCGANGFYSYKKDDVIAWMELEYPAPYREETYMTKLHCPECDNLSLPGTTICPKCGFPLEDWCKSSWLKYRCVSVHDQAYPEFENHPFYAEAFFVTDLEGNVELTLYEGHFDDEDDDKFNDDYLISELSAWTKVIYPMPFKYTKG